MENLDVSHILAIFGQYEEPLREYGWGHMQSVLDAGFLLFALYCFQLFQLFIKTFYGMVHFDVTYFQEVEGGYKLRIRTVVAEMPLTELFPNRVLRWAFWHASRNTLEGDPILRMKNPDQRQLVLNRLVNLISSQYGEHFLREAMGQTVKKERFWLVPTFELGEDLPVRKTRVLLISKHVMECPHLFQPVFLEKDHQKTRLETLNAIWREVNKIKQKQAAGFPIDDEHIASVEIAVD